MNRLCMLRAMAVLAATACPALFGSEPLAAAAQAEKVEKTLLGHWRFDEGVGDLAVDSSGHGNDGEIHGADWVRGKFGTALYFGGRDAAVVIPGRGPAGVGDHASAGLSPENRLSDVRRRIIVARMVGGQLHQAGIRDGPQRRPGNRRANAGGIRPAGRRAACGLADVAGPAKFPEDPGRARPVAAERTSSLVGAASGRTSRCRGTRRAQGIDLGLIGERVQSLRPQKSCSSRRVSTGVANRRIPNGTMARGAGCRRPSPCQRTSRGRTAGQ